MSSDLEIRSRAEPAAAEAARPCAVRAWIYLVWFCLRRQARARQMVWIALGLLAFTVASIALNTAAGRWGFGHRHYPYRSSLTLDEYLADLQALRQPASLFPAVASVLDSLAETSRAVLAQSGFYVFSTWVVFSVFLSFLLPMWSLSFATETVGGEREAGTLLWLLARPLPRSMIYLAKFVALLPWGLGLNLGGFALLCLAAGKPGQLAFRLYWPAILWGTLAFCALFQLMGAFFRKPAVVAIVYTFFLETVLGNMPGTMKRMSLSFYTRCMMFASAESHGYYPTENHPTYMAVDGTTALLVLVSATVVLLAAGMVLFARSEYQDLT